MARSKKIAFRASPEFEEALRAYCEEHGVEVSDVIRTAVAEWIEQPELLDTIRPKGRPRQSNDD